LEKTKKLDHFAKEIIILFFSCNAFQFHETSHRCDLFILEEEKYQSVLGGSQANNQSIIRVNEAFKKCELLIYFRNLHQVTFESYSFYDGE
jgi:hypothetical protein